MKRRSQDEARRRLYEIARIQEGLFTAEDAVSAGYSRRLHTYHVQRGHWLRIERAIYRLREFPESRYEDLARWTLWSRGKGVISHDAAAAFHELGDLMPAHVHLTVPPGFRKRVPSSIVVHRGRLQSDEVREATGFRVTTPLRTILDLLLSGTESDRLASVVRDALERGAVRRRALEAAFSKLKKTDGKRAKRVLTLVEETARAV